MTNEPNKDEVRKVLLNYETWLSFNLEKGHLDMNGTPAQHIDIYLSTLPTPESSGGESSAGNVTDEDKARFHKWHKETFIYDPYIEPKKINVHNVILFAKYYSTLNRIGNQTALEILSKHINVPNFQVRIAMKNLSDERKAVLNAMEEYANQSPPSLVESQAGEDSELVEDMKHHVGRMNKGWSYNQRTIDCFTKAIHALKGHWREYSRLDLECAHIAGWGHIDFEDWFKNYIIANPK